MLLAMIHALVVEGLAAEVRRFVIEEAHGVVESPKRAGDLSRVAQRIREL